jgi:pimeloyl-ACP methyl ester carboxylesterase
LKQGDLHVDESGPADAPVVVLVHGSMDRASRFAKVAHRLDGEFRVVRYDRRGYGHSVDAIGPYDMKQQVGDLHRVMDERRVVLIGHSYGGNVVLATAEQYPAQVRAVGVFEVPMPWLPLWPATTAGGAVTAFAVEGSEDDAAERFVRRMVGDQVWESLPEHTRQARRAEGKALVGELVDLDDHVPFSASGVACPVIVARGEDGAEHHRMGADELSRWFSTDIVTLEGAGHGAHASHPDAFAGFVRAVMAAADEARA